jgi:hypothetical protein
MVVFLVFIFLSHPWRKSSRAIAAIGATELQSPTTRDVLDAYKLIGRRSKLRSLASFRDIDCAATPRTEVAMPKRKPREITGFERVLVELIDKASPGRIVLSKTRHVFDGGESGFELQLETRSGSISYLDRDLEDSLHCALHDLNSGEEDPIRPAWTRVSRHHREVAIRTLQALESRHMARAAKAQLGAKYSAAAEYGIADAFHAALAVLWTVDDYDENGELLPGTPKLEAEGPPEPIHITKPRKRTAKVEDGPR